MRTKNDMVKILYCHRGRRNLGKESGCLETFAAEAVGPKCFARGEIADLDQRRDLESSDPIAVAPAGKTIKHSRSQEQKTPQRCRLDDKNGNDGEWFNIY